MGEWSFYLLAVPELGDLTEMVEGRGYWIKVNKDVILTTYGDSTEGIVPEIEQEILIAVITEDLKSIPANLKFLGRNYDLFYSNNISSLLLDEYHIIIIDYLVGTQGEEVGPSFDITEWVQTNYNILFQWLREGGTLIDFSGGEGFALYDLNIIDSHDLLPLHTINTEDIIFQNPNKFVYSNFTSIMYADAYVTGGADLLEFNVIANGTHGPVALIKEINAGRILYVTIMQHRSIFRRGFFDNILSWASNGSILTQEFSIKESVIDGFRLIYPDFAISNLILNSSLSIVYSNLVTLAGHNPNVGEELIIDFTIDLDWDFNIWAAGLAGNPVYVDVWQLPELIGNERVLLGITFHELGHVVFGWADFLKEHFGEAFADIACLYTFETLGLDEYYRVDEQRDLYELEIYTSSGANFSELTSGALMGMFLSLKDDYNWTIFNEYFRYVEPTFDYTELPYNDRLSLFVHYLSLSAGDDLFPRFIDWGFPINYVEDLNETTIAHARVQLLGRHGRR